MYGYERGEVVPTMDMVMPHIEPADRPKVQAYWEHVSTHGGPSSIYVPIQDRKGRKRRLLYSADYIVDGDTPVGVWGVVVDVTAAIHKERHQLATEAIAATVASTAPIEQAKGILMGRTGVSAEDAYALIDQRSKETGRTVYEIVRDVIQSASGKDRKQERPPL